MKDEYKVVSNIRAKTYERWQKFAESKQVRTFGHKASITDFTSGYVTEMMEEVLKEAGI
jgi:hypothetical protein